MNTNKAMFERFLRLPTWKWNEPALNEMED